MAEEKRFPPSDLKLERLRKQGEVPYSPDTWTFAAFAALCGGLLMSASLISPALEAAAALLWSLPDAYSAKAGAGEFTLTTEARRCLYTAAKLSAGLLIAVTAAVVFLGLLQTRMMIAFGAFAPGASRFSSPLGLFSRARIAAAAAALLKAGTALLLLGWLAGDFYQRQLALTDPLSPLSTAPSQPADSELLGSGFSAGDMRRALKDELSRYAGVVKLAAGTAATLAFFVALCSYFLAHYNFFRRHAMTRSELEAEYREMEQSSDLRRARQESAGTDTG